jgi:hypothetical protein
VAIEFSDSLLEFVDPAILLRNRLEKTGSHGGAKDVWKWISDRHCPRERIADQRDRSDHQANENAKNRWKPLRESLHDILLSLSHGSRDLGDLVGLEARPTGPE